VIDLIRPEDTAFLGVVGGLLAQLDVAGQVKLQFGTAFSLRGLHVVKQLLGVATARPDHQAVGFHIHQPGGAGSADIEDHTSRDHDGLRALGSSRCYGDLELAATPRRNREIAARRDSSPRRRGRGARGRWYGRWSGWGWAGRWGRAARWRWLRRQTIDRPR